MTGKKGILLPIIAVSILLTGTVLSTMKVKEYSCRPYLYANLYLPSGKFMEQVSLGYKQIVADMVWLSAVQYYGGYRKDYHDLAYFEGLIRLVTDLDPHFVFPYTFGALVLSQDMANFDRGIDILKKGMAHNPTSWQLPFEIGFLSYVDARDPETAARYFDLASRLPNSPDFTKRFAAFVYSQSGHYETSIRMWEEIAETTEEPYLQQLAKRYLEKLKREQHNGRQAVVDS
jgi:tetratricopeptide (TPR) repeat protein